MAGNMKEVPVTRRFLVTGGHGFIGSYVAKALFERGDFVRIADINPSSAFTEPICTEMVVGNLCDLAFCERAVRGVDTVLHFAASVGGTSAICEKYDDIIYRENATMTQHMLSASRDTSVRTFFYASSTSEDGDTWSSDVPIPSGLYSLEKLSSELLLLQGASKMTVYIARFHKVYGPRGMWVNGDENAPAAMLRKAIAAQMLSEPPVTSEVWRDGKLRRSFLYIDDCVDAVLLLLKSFCRVPINIGSDQFVTIDLLAEVTGRCAGLQMENGTLDQDDGSRPVNVSAQNTGNGFVNRTLRWSPKVSLEEGIKRTADWIRHEIEDMVLDITDEERLSVLQNLRHSQILNFPRGYITFAVILPITSRGSESPIHCLSTFGIFAESLERTTWRDTHQIGGLRFKLRVYLSIDEDDAFLRRCDDKGINIAEAVLLSKNIPNVIVEICNQPWRCVYDVWRQCAKQALQDGCDYFVLMGNDVVLMDEGWMRDAHNQFAEMSRYENVPRGFGCVAFTDITFPGLPTFPIVHRTHMEIFAGSVIPDNFVNQDGGDFLYQLYRRWNCSVILPCRISNAIGGSHPSRYARNHIDGWTFEPLDRATVTVERWLLLRCPSARRRLTIDVVVPSYRVQIPLLDGILNLRSSSTCTVMFIIIIDNPLSPSICELQKKYAHRPDVRIRINAENMGVSATRNRGMEKSAAEWIVFLDDDIVPDEHLLEEAEKAIRKHPKAAGFIGNVHFPPPDTVFKTALTLAGFISFFNIAEQMPGEVDMPWGVAANLIVHRVDDGVEYGLQFPKTGGGEDVDFCRQKRKYSMTHGGEGFHAAPKVLATHPWWNGGRRSYWRFYRWAIADGELVKLYPELCYLDDAPNSAELLLISAILAVVGLVVYVLTGITIPLVPGLHLAAATFAGNIVHELFRHLWIYKTRPVDISSTLTGLMWVMAVMESAIIKMISEVGCVSGNLGRKEFSLFGRRFEWYAHRMGNGPIEEARMVSRQRLVIVSAILVLSLAVVYK